MLESPILDIILILAFVYFNLSLLTSSLNEILFTILRMRGKMLYSGIKSLFSDDQWASFADNIMASPFIISLKRYEKSFPSYIPAKNFAQALLEQFRDKNTGVTDISSIKAAIENGQCPNQLKSILLNTIGRVGNDIEKVGFELEEIYDNAMERVVGWYKRKVQVVIVLLAIIIATYFNIDTLKYVRDLYSNEQNTLEKASKVSLIASKIQKDTTGTYLTFYDSSKGAIIQHVHHLKVDTVSQLDSNSLKSAYNQFADLVNKNRSEDIVPLGWSNAELLAIDILHEPFTKCTVSLINKLLGILITVLAVYFGAPFWYDVMSKASLLRGAGIAPNDKKRKI